MTRAELTRDALERWEAHGASWRTLQVSDRQAVVEFCTCYGEPVDVLEGDSRELIDYVRERSASGPSLS